MLLLSERLKSGRKINQTFEANDGTQIVGFSLVLPSSSFLELLTVDHSLAVVVLLGNRL